jgi:UbiD family decarboxylase
VASHSNGRHPPLASSPVVVSDAPILENVLNGAEVDLTRFPVPLWHEHDGGRYIGTGCAVVTSDPSTGRVNLGAYRVMLQDEGRSVSIDAQAGKQGRNQYTDWFAKQGRAPVLVSLGQHPLLLMVAGTEVPASISEYAYAGAMVGHHSGLCAARLPACRCQPRRRSSWRVGCARTTWSRRDRLASGLATTPVRRGPCRPWT